MPKVSSTSAPQRQEAGPVVDLRDELDGYTASFTSLLEDIDATPFMKGLPDDRCQAPHWGYLFSGKIVVHYRDRSETVEGGQAYYIEPGHAIEFLEDSEALEFTPTEALEQTFAAVRRNAAESDS